MCGKGEALGRRTQLARKVTSKHMQRRHPFDSLFTTTTKSIERGSWEELCVCVKWEYHVRKLKVKFTVRVCARVCEP